MTAEELAGELDDDGTILRLILAVTGGELWLSPADSWAENLKRCRAAAIVVETDAGGVRIRLDIPPEMQPRPALFNDLAPVGAAIVRVS